MGQVCNAISRSTESVGKSMKDRFRKRMCGKKRRYVTRREAKEVVKRMKKRGKKGNRPYRCVFCDYWHIGHPKLSNYDDNG